MMVLCCVINLYDITRIQQVERKIQKGQGGGRGMGLPNKGLEIVKLP
jgi:hypothetical protein